MSSTQPGEVPGFDWNREPEQIYQPEQILERALWPVVNELWRGDWQTESVVGGPPLVYPKSYPAIGGMVQVELGATCELGEEINGTRDPVHSVNLSVEETILDESRSFLLESSREKYEIVEQAKRSMRESEGDFDENEDMDLWPNGNEDDFIIKKGSVYFFDDTGDWHINYYHVLVGEDSQLTMITGNGDSREEHESREPFQKYRFHDIETIQAAFSVLGASQTLLDVLDDIKANPVAEAQ